jgi:hypothetical protein
VIGCFGQNNSHRSDWPKNINGIEKNDYLWRKLEASAIEQRELTC